MRMRFPNAVPIERNGTNRFATVFLYLNDAAKGGETVFPSRLRMLPITVVD